MKNPPRSREVERWSPMSWGEIAGNSELISVLRNFAANGPCNLLATGPKRSGKTRTLKHGIKAHLCSNRSVDLEPCGLCAACKEVDDPFGRYTGISTAINGSKFKFVQIDCENVSDEQLKNLPHEIEWDDESLIVYLDEVGALGVKGRDTRLLKPIDEWPCVWIASAVSVTERSWIGTKKQMTKGLSEAVRARFAVKVGTALPGAKELTFWIKKNCHEWQILIEEPELTIPMLMKRARHRIGYVKQPIAVAASRGKSLETRRLTLEDVACFNFEAEE